MFKYKKQWFVRNIAANSSASPGGAGWGVEGGGLDAGREGDGIGTSLGLKVQDQRVKYAPSLQPLYLYGNACVHSLAGLASEVCSPCIAPLAILINLSGNAREVSANVEATISI